MQARSYPQQWQSRKKYRFQFWLIMAFVLLQMAFSAMTVSAQQAPCAVDVMLVLDRSGSMIGAPLTAAQNASVTFINQLNFAMDRVGLVSFNSSAVFQNPPGLTNNGVAVQNAINGLTASGGTAIHAGITTAMNALLANPNPNASPVMILLTDGESNEAQAAAAAAQAATNGIRIIVIGLGNNVNTNFLQNQIATTPNDYYASPTPAQLQQIYATILQNLCPGRICGRKFHDVNSNGTQDNSEPGLSNWQIIAQNQQGASFAATTGANGDYCVTVPAGAYTVAEIQQAPWVQTFPVQPGTHSVTVQAGATVTNINFGNRLPNGSIRGIKFWDMNGNGVRDQIAGSGTIEPLLDGFQFSLYSGNPNNPLTWNLVAGPVTITNANSGYQFTNIPPGTYFIREIARPGWSQTFPPQNHGAHLITLTAGQHVKGLDFGNRACQGPCTSYIMGFKFRDNNHNATWDSSEPRLGSVTIELVNASGAVVQTTTTNANGLYFFLNVSTGVYTVREKPMAGWVQTTPNTNGSVHTITITQGVNGVELNFGNYRCSNTIVAEPYPQDPPIDTRTKAIPMPTRQEACVTGVKFHDMNGDGVQAPNEPPLSGFVFQLQSVANPSQVFWATSDAYGNYAFIVPPGEYTLVEIYGLPSLDWSLSPNSAASYHVNVGSGSQVSGLTFGNWMCKEARDSRCQCSGGKEDVMLTVKAPEVVAVGQKAQYAVTLINAGSCATAGGNTLYLKLPSGVTPLERAWTVEGWQCQALGSTLQCVQQEALKDGATSTIPVDVLVSDDIDTEIQSCATIIARNDSNLKNNAICVQSKVEGASDAKAEQEATVRVAREEVTDQSAAQPDTLRQKIYLPVTFN